MNHPVRVVISVALLVGALLFLQLRSRGEAVPLRKSLDSFPTVVGEWQGRESTIFDADILNVLKVKDYIVRRYVDSAGRSLWLYVGYWDSQRKGVMPHSPRNCLPGSGWEPLEASRLDIAVAGLPDPLTVNRFVIQKERDQQVVLYWYVAQGRPVVGEVEARVAMMRSAMFRNRTDGALVRVSSAVHGSIAETTDRLVQYVQTVYPLLDAYLPG